MSILPFLLIFSLIGCCIELDISVPSFPDMAHYFGVSGGVIQLTIAYNALGFCLSSLFYGPLSESYGRRNVMIAGNAILVIGAIGCVFAPSIPFLLVSRFIQGIGASTSAVVTFSMIADTYKGGQAIRFIGIMNSILTILMAIAPVIGSFINEAVGWRGNYSIVAMCCLASWILMFFFLPETKANCEPFSFKKVRQDYGKLLSSGKFINASLVPSLLCSGYICFVTCASFLYMETFNLPIITYSLHQSSIVGAFSIISILSDKIINRFGTTECLTKGIYFSLGGVVGFVVVSLISPNSPYLITSCMIIFASGFAICYPAIFASSLEIFPEIKGTASSAIMSMRFFLCSALIGSASYLYNGQPIMVAIPVLCAVVLAFIFTRSILKSGQFSKSTAKAA